MSVYVITYEQGHKVARRVPSREEYLRLRGSAEQRKNVYLARQGDESAKRRLVQMNYSCRPADGVLRGCRTPSDTVGMDVDFDPADPDYGRKMAEVPRLVLSKKDELALRLLERSARKGYHIVFRRRPELTQEQNLQWAQRLLGVKYDAGAKDLTRVFFTTTDSPEDLLFLDDAIFETDSGGGSGNESGSQAAVPVASPAAETVPEATSGAGLEASGTGPGASEANRISEVEPKAGTRLETSVSGTFSEAKPRAKTSISGASGVLALGTNPEATSGAGLGVSWADSKAGVSEAGLEFSKTTPKASVVTSGSSLAAEALEVKGISETGPGAEGTSGPKPGVGLGVSEAKPEGSVVTSGSSLAAGASGVKDASVRALEAPDTEARTLEASAPATETPALEASVPGPGIPEAKNLGTEASEAEIPEATEAPKIGIPVAEDLEAETSEAAEAPEASEVSEAAADPPLSYEGMPYPEIIGKWWELHNGGQTPVRSNRDTLTFELAVNLRHICGFDRQLLRRVIPCYDGFPEAERDKCIDSALETRRTQMPRRLRAALAAVRAEHTADGGVVQALDEAVEQDDLYYYRRLRTALRTQGLAESVAAVGPRLALPVLTAVCPAIGTLATGVEVVIHGSPSRLNLFSFVCGEAASGKGSIDPVVEAWTDDLKQQDAVYLQQEADYRAQARRAKNERKQPEEPKLPVRLLTLNNTLANLSDRLANTGGRHAFSYTCEADLVAQKWRSALSDYSVMLRQAFDGSSFHREAKSAEAVNVHIDHLHWNVTMCGTQDALYRVIPNCTDGLLSRVALARTPDNTFARLEQRPPRLTAEQAARIRQTARVVGLMQGRVELARLEARSQQWTEAVRVAALKDNDRVMARCRMRDHVIAYRMTACLLLCAAAERMVREYGETGAVQRLTADPQAFAEWAVRSQTPAMLEAYDALADSLLENDLHFVRERIERAYNGDDYRTEASGRCKRGRNDSIFARLPQEFSFEQAYRMSGQLKERVTRNSVHQMLKNWRRQGLVEMWQEGWRKTGMV